MARHEPAGLASDLAPFSLCTSELADALWASPYTAPVSGPPAAGLDQKERGRTLALARCRKTTQPRYARLRGRHRRRRVRGDNANKKAARGGRVGTSLGWGGPYSFNHAVSGNSR